MSITSFLPQAAASYALVAIVVYAETAPSHAFILSRILSNLPVGIADLYGARRAVVAFVQRALQIGDFSHKRGQQASFSSSSYANVGSSCQPLSAARRAPFPSWYA